MLVADTYVGHRDDPSVAGLLADADRHRVVLSDTDRRRSRVRTTTTDGRDLGVVVGRTLEDGDVLETDGSEYVVVELASIEALVVDFADADVSATAAVELGHAAGNRHWDLAVSESEALFPATESRERMEATLADVLPAGAAIRYEDVPPGTFDDEHGHGHSENHSHDHSHAQSENHSHDHAHDYSHDHASRGGDGP